MAGDLRITLVLRVAAASDHTYVVSVPLAGIDMEGEGAVAFAGGEVIFRHLSDVELGAMIPELGHGRGAPGLTIQMPRVVQELRLHGPRLEQGADPRCAIGRWLAALQLRGHQVAGYSARYQIYPRWLSWWFTHYPVALPRHVRTWSTLTSNDLQKVGTTANQLSGYNTVEPRSEHDLALHRFCSGAARASDADAVLDFVIALESLLLPYDENARHGDLGYRFRVHGAHYLAAELYERKAVFKQLTDLYSLRSRLVHGGKYPRPEEISAGRESAMELARTGLLRAVHEGFPTAAMFNNMVIGV